MTSAPATPPTQPWNHTPVSSRAVVLLLLGAFALLCAHGLAWDTPTVDEFAHLPAGYYYLKTGDFNLFALNPPLVKLLSALPLLALHPALDPHPRIQHTGWYPWVFGTDFMERNRANYDGIFLFGRLPIVALGLLGGWLTWRWARDLHGSRAGLVALTLYAFCPSLVAHAHLATVDVGAAALTVAALYAFDRWLRRPTAGRLALAGLLLGLAQLSKFTALLLYPVLLLLALLAPQISPPASELAAPPAGRPGLPARRLGGLLVICLVSVAVLQAGYLYQGIGTPLADLHLESRSLARLVSLLPSRFPSPLPAPYLKGLDGLQLVNEQGEFPAYLFGSWSMRGWASYYLIALLFKTPLPFLLACLAAPFCPLRHRPEERAVWLPALLLLAAFSLLSRIDYGIRYVLPVLPLAAIYVSRLVPWVEARGRALRLAALGLLAVYPLSILLATPDTLAYFNLLAGRHPDRILLDSNLDWGQGLKRLAAYMKKEGITEIGLAYFGHVDPAIYGIAWHFPDPGRPEKVAVSANFLHGYPYATYAQGRILPVPADAFTWIARYPQVATPGGGLFIHSIAPSRSGPAPTSTSAPTPER